MTVPNTTTQDEELRTAFHRIRREAEVLAGKTRDLSQRATTYHHLYQDSGGNHVFPLIAAHGALWARGYFQFGVSLGKVLSMQFFMDRAKQQEQLKSLNAFAEAFREINRIVCVDTYTTYHLTKLYGEDRRLLEFLSEDLLTAYARIHHARRAGVRLSDSELRSIFRAFFDNEQEQIVAPRIAAAMERFQWPLLKTIAIRPVIRFAYFPNARWFWFRNFTNQQERTDRGLQAFDLAAQVGWEQVAEKLRAYNTLPESFFVDSTVHFQEMRVSLLRGIA